MKSSVKTRIRIGRIVNYSSPQHLLVQSGYFYYHKKGGGHSYVRKDEPRGRFEAYVVGSGIEIHYDVWLGKHGHMTLPSTHTLQEEEKRIRSIMYKKSPETPIVNAKRQRRRERGRLGIDTPRPQRKKGVVFLPQKNLSEIDWARIKKLNNIKDKHSYPQSTTCTLLGSMLRWIKTKVTPWL